MAHSFELANQAPLELDYLIHTIRNPGPDVTVEKVLGFIYNYLPFVKQEHNLRLVFASFLNNPVCFGQNVPLYELNYLIVEVFKLIADKKLQVSQPTLPIKTFYEVLLRELRNFVNFDRVRNSWKALPILAGLALSNELRDLLYTNVNVIQYKWFFSDWDSSADTLFKKCLQFSLYGAANSETGKLSILSLALYYKLSEDISDYLGPLHPKILIIQLMEMIYGPHGGANVYKVFAQTGPNDPQLEEFVRVQVIQKPVVKHLNRLSTLFDQLVKILPYDEESFELIMSVVLQLTDFSQMMNRFTSDHKSLNASTDELTEVDIYEQQYWLLMKRILFSQVIMFQGVLSRFLTARNVGFVGHYLAPSKHVSRMESEYCDICRHILHCLYFLNFVLASVGLGGFDGYNFIYYVSLEICLQNNRRGTFELFSRFLLGNINEVNLHHDNLNANYVALTKVLFGLGLWENYLQQMQKSVQRDEKFIEYIYEATFDLVRNPYLANPVLIEAGHSVLLVYFSNKANTSHNFHQFLSYFDLLSEQFPRLLSANQLSVAVETLGKKVLSSPFRNEPGSLYPTTADEFLEFVYFKCANTTPGQPIGRSTDETFSSAQPISEISAESTMKQLKKTSDGNTDIVKQNKHKKPKDLAVLDVVSTKRKDPTLHFSERVSPETSREGAIVAFFNVIPYLPMSILVHWLNKIWMLIEGSNQAERLFLVGRLWTVLGGNLDLNRCEVAYAWWYEKRLAVEKDIGQEKELYKL